MGGDNVVKQKKLNNWNLDSHTERRPLSKFFMVTRKGGCWNERQEHFEILKKVFISFSPFSPLSLSMNSFLYPCPCTFASIPLPLLRKWERSHGYQPDQVAVRIGTSPPIKAGQMSRAHIVYKFFNCSSVEVCKQNSAEDLACNLYFAADKSNNRFCISNPYLLFKHIQFQFFFNSLKKV